MSVTENPLCFSASLAQTIGLNEAILFHFLQQGSLLSNAQFTLTHSDCQKMLGFWEFEQVHQLFLSLNTLGLIELTQSNAGAWVGRVQNLNSVQNSDALQNQAPQVSVSDPQVNQSNFITQSSKVVDPQVPVNAQQPENEPLQRVEIITDSRPDDRVNEARMYNQNRGNPLGHLQQPKSTPVYAQSGGVYSGNSLSKMNVNWEPSEQFHEMLRLHNIPTQFANEQLPVFKQYYIDSGKTAMSWDSRFINWVQRAKASVRSQEGQYEQTQPGSSSGQNAKQRKEEVRKKLRDINDTSWAD